MFQDIRNFQALQMTMLDKVIIVAARVLCCAGRDRCIGSGLELLREPRSRVGGAEASRIPLMVLQMVRTSVFVRGPSM